VTEFLTLVRLVLCVLRGQLDHDMTDRLIVNEWMVLPMLEKTVH